VSSFNKKKKTLKIVFKVVAHDREFSLFLSRLTPSVLISQEHKFALTRFTNHCKSKVTLLPESVKFNPYHTNVENRVSS